MPSIWKESHIQDTSWGPTVERLLADDGGTIWRVFLKAALSGSGFPNNEATTWCFVRIGGCNFAEVLVWIILDSCPRASSTKHQGGTCNPKPLHPSTFKP